MCKKKEGEQMPMGKLDKKNKGWEPILDACGVRMDTGPRIM